MDTEALVVVAEFYLALPGFVINDYASACAHFKEALMICPFRARGGAACPAGAPRAQPVHLPKTSSSLFSPMCYT